MKTYAFILGRKYLLSIAEICQSLPSNSEIIDHSREALIIKLPELIDPQATLNQLGGSIKVVEIKEELFSHKTEAIAQAISTYCFDEFKNLHKKFSYGISIYSFHQPPKNILKKILNFSKNTLKEKNLKSRYINKDFTNVQNAALKGEKILEEGAEFIAIQGSKSIFIGKTVALQDFEGYSKRDYDRPERDARLGMLPPKLAQLMINLSGINKFNKKTPKNLEVKTIYDPFCGIGTVLSEAYLMGFNVIGSDINTDVLIKADKNLAWIENESSHPRQKIRLFDQNAEYLSKKDLSEKIDALISETYLGPPMSHFPSHQQLKETFHALEKTILNFFKALHSFLPEKTPIVISLLAYREKNRYITMNPLISQIERVGFQAEDLIPSDIQKQLNLPLFKDKSLIYDRPDQIVCRAIWKFHKINPVTKAKP